ncbi:hypothetical protein QUW17_07900 [Bacteroides gallinaceum]|uniref:hypothetical protein n=1 Tax=Bacteroides gallinaceum TaxID=1462571 RepID=UPI0025A44FA9|nr:hypothetical protein [Bacteroides gallinaceum]MDM8207800.1 hypothetical protein [Bacteroides gallinaceum]
MKGLCLTIFLGALSAIFSICKAQEVKIDFNLTYDKSKNEMTLTVSNMGDKDVLLLNQVSETLNGGFIFLYYKTFDGISASRSLPLIDYDSKNSRRILQKELPAKQQFMQVYNLTQALAWNARKAQVCLAVAYWKDDHFELEHLYKEFVF